MNNLLTYLFVAFLGGHDIDSEGSSQVGRFPARAQRVQGARRLHNSEGV